MHFDHILINIQLPDTKNILNEAKPSDRCRSQSYQWLHNYIIYILLVVSFANHYYTLNLLTNSSIALSELQKTFYNGKNTVYYNKPSNKIYFTY